MPIKFQYPEIGWSTGKMRRRGQRPDNGNGNGDDARVMQVMDVRRGRPELEEPGIAEAEKMAGAGIEARGGGGLSPEIIQQHKSQILGFAQQWQIGAINWRNLQKQVNDLGWDIALEQAKKGEVGEAVKSGTQSAWESLAARDPTSLADIGAAAVRQLRKQDEASGKRTVRFEVTDPDGNSHFLELEK
jgi:hypothetical protein